MEPAALITLIILGATAAALYGGRDFLRIQNQHRLDEDRLTYLLTFPKHLSVDQAKRFLRALSSRSFFRADAFGGIPAVVLETWSTEHGFAFRVKVPGGESQSIINQLQTSVPGIRADLELEPPGVRWTYAAEWADHNKGMSFNVRDSGEVAAAILASMQSPGKGEAALLQVVLSPRKQEEPPTHQKPLRTKNFLMDVALHKLANSKEEIDDRAAKLSEHNMDAVIRVAVRAPNRERAAEMFRAIEDALRRIHTHNNYLERLKYRNPLDQQTLWQRIASAAGMLSYPSQLNVTEAVAFSAWPVDSPYVMGLPQLRTRFLPASPDVAHEGIVIADSNVPGRERPVAITTAGSTMHTYISAPTGGGKSVTLGNFFAQAVARGSGAMVIETKGEKDDLFHKCLNYVPAERVAAGDVIVVDITDPTHAVSVNILEQGNPQTIASDLQGLIDDIYGASGVTVPEALYHGLMVLMTTTAAQEKLTFTDLPLLFEPMTVAEFEYGQKLVAGTPDRRIRNWWKLVYEDCPNPKKLRAYFKPIHRRIWQINSRPELSYIFGQSKSSFNMAQAIRENKIILVNIAGLGDTVRSLVGAVLINMVWAAIKEGSANPRRPFYLLLDEFQNYPNIGRDSGVMLAEGRAFGLALVLANQGIKQLSTGTADAVRVNTRNKIVMQTDHTNARVFVQDIGADSVTEDDLVNLGQYEAVARVVGRNHGVSQPMTLKMRPPLPGTGLAAAVRQKSRELYARPIKEVEAEINGRGVPDHEDKPKKERSPLGKRGEGSW